MLVLHRRLLEKLIIGENIHIRVLGIKGKQVVLGIDAPPEISILREEVFERNKEHSKGIDQIKKKVV